MGKSESDDGSVSSPRRGASSMEVEGERESASSIVNESDAPRDRLTHWTNIEAESGDSGREQNGEQRASSTVSRPSLQRWSDSDLDPDTVMGGHRSGSASPIEANGSSFGFEYIEAPAAKWTFDPKSIRRYVESRLEGRVLNLFSGENQLRHTDEIVRNDLDDSIEADHHFDALEVAEHFSPRSFDTILLDPPYNVRKAREKYNGRYRGEFTVIKDRIIPLVKLGGRVIHFGYASTGMGRSRGFENREVCLINHKGDHNDTICVIEERIEGGLNSYTPPSSTTTDDLDTDENGTGANSHSEGGET